MPSPTEHKADRLHGIAVTALGVLVLTPDSLLVRMIATDTWTLVFWRSLLMALSIALAYALRGGTTALARALRRTGVAGLAVAVLFAGSTALFVVSIRLTAVANTLLIIAVAPLLAAALSRIFLAEAVPARTWIAAVIALGGIATIAGGSGLERPGAGGSVLGDLAALGAGCCFAANLVVVRRARSIDMVPALVLSGLLLALVLSPFAAPAAVSARDMAYLMVLGGLVVPLSFALITRGPRHLPAAEVSLIMLLETVLGPLWVWLGLGEVPPAATFAGGALVLATLATHAGLGLRAAAEAGHG